MYSNIYTRILDPVIYGKYPKEMVNILGPALPQFSSNEVKNLENSRADFIGINHYTSYFVQDCLTSACNTGHGAFKAEGFALKLDRKGNVSIGELVSLFIPRFSFYICDYILKYLLRC